MDFRKISIAFIFIFGAIGIFFILSSFKKTPPKTPPPVIKRYVKVEKIKYGNIHSRVTGSGRLSSKQTVDVITEVQGKILSGDVPLKKAQSFKKGALLFRLYDKEAQLALLARKSRFLNSIANLLPDFKVDFPQSYPTWTSFLSTIVIEHPLPALPAITSAKEKIFLAGRNILSDYYSLKSEELRLKKYAVHAPFTGSYTDVLLQVGAAANKGSRVGKIIRTDKLELEVPIEVQNAAWIKFNDPVQVLTEDGSNEWSGRVVRKSDFVDQRTQSISVFVGLEPTGDNPLFSGLYLKAVFSGIMVENAMEIPRNAVFNSNEVFLVQEKRLIKKAIKIHKLDEKSLIFSGLNKGEDIVVEPLVNAVENMSVEPFTGEKPVEKPGKVDDRQNDTTAGN
ncbi:MAG: HlyD family efflux transporter periplasmic adaptor subunit [bacterium]|nr:HlyD family efflux transporter periplasmic adaptor subunit [bacterium]